MSQTTAQTLEQFAADCRRILKTDSGPAGLEQVRQRLEECLKDASFVDTYLGPVETSARKVIYEDSELGFCVLSHVYEGPKDSNPHDHGPSWAIYGQAKGVTHMTEWRKVAPPGNGDPGKVEVVKTYDMTPGMARAYGIGDIHSPRRDGETRLIRMEGINMESVERDRYEAVS